MNKKIFVTVSMLVSTFSFSAHADIVQKRVLEFKGVETMVDDINQPEKTLVVIDFQDTLASLACDFDQPTQENCPYIGSVPWFNWQVSLLESAPDSEHLVAKSKRELIEISNVFLENTVLGYTEEATPSVLDSLLNKNLRIMFITQYGSLNRLVESVSTQLPLNKELKTSAADIIANSSPSLVEPLEALAVCNEPESRNVNYQNGVLYTNGEDKVAALKCFLKEYNAQIAQQSEESKSAKGEAEEGKVPAAVKVIQEARKVVYVDDSYDETVAFYKTYRGRNDYDIFALYYTKPEMSWKPLLADGKEAVLQEQAHKYWLEIKEDVLGKIFIDK